MERVTREDLIKMIINNKEIMKMDLPNYKIKKICRTFLDSVSSKIISMEEGDKMEIRGIGTFLMRKRKGYTAHNPKTMEKVECKEKLVLSFKTGQLIRSLLNKKGIRKGR